MFRHGNLLLLFLLLLFFVRSQSPPNTYDYRRAYNAAEKWYTSPDANNTTDSLALISYQNVILLLSKKNMFSDTLLDSYLKCGIICMGSNENEKAMRFFHGAIGTWKKAGHLPDSLLFRPYLYEGNTQYNSNNLDSAVYFYKQAEEISNRNVKLSETERLYNKLGVLYYETGDYRKSIRYYEKALSVATGKKAPNNDFIIIYKSNIATSLVRMEEYLPALNIYKDLVKYHVNSDDLFANMGFLYQQLGNNQEALQLLRLIKQNTPRKFNNLTGVFLKTEQYDSARFYNHRALSFFVNKNGAGANTLFGIALKHAGDIAVRLGNAGEGLRNYQSAIAQLLPGFKDTSATKNPLHFNGLQNFSFLFDVLTAKAAAFGQLDALDHGHLYKQYALAAYTSAISLARYVERTYSSDDARLFLKTKVNPACGEAIATALELYNRTKDPQYIAAAFGYAENNKASVLQAGLQQLELSGIAGLPAELITAEKKYKSQIARLTIQLPQVKDTAAAIALQNKLRDTELLLSKTQDKLDENPAWHRLKFGAREMSFEKIKEQLKNKDAAVLSYYYTGNQLICFYITAAQTGYSSIALQPVFFAAISNLLKELEAPAGSDRKMVNTAAVQLYQLLLQPVIDKIKDKKQLVIIPYNEISYVPFELLKDDKSGSLLLNRFAISYNYSANFLFDEDAGKGGAYHVLAMAPFSGKDNAPLILPALTSSGAETANLPGKQLTGNAATRAQFIALSGQYPVIHLATHAVANDKDPLGCYIEFYGEKNDPDSLHRLYEKEIYNLDMKSARLVILSACETGNGLLVNGEGIESLSRAFSYAGCKSVITSLWKADDAATGFIMKQLHVYLQRGYAKDEALQQAKIDYLNSSSIEDRYKAPSYWAHLILIGNRQPVVAGHMPWYIYAIGGLLLLAGLLLVYCKRKRVQ